MNSKQTKRKGLTLIEIIISIAVYAVLALLLTEIMTLVNTMMRSTEQLNNRLNYEAKYADNQITTDDLGVSFDNQEVDVAISYQGGAATSAKSVSLSNMKATQYTAHFSEQDVVQGAASNTLIAVGDEDQETNLHRATNFKFMTYEAPVPSTAEEEYTVHLLMDLSQTMCDKISKIAFKNAALADSQSATIARDFTAGEDIPIRLKNSATTAETTKANTHQPLTIEIYTDSDTAFDIAYDTDFYTATVLGDTVSYSVGTVISYRGGKNDDTFSAPKSTTRESEIRSLITAVQSKYIT